MSIAGTWQNEYGSIMTLAVQENTVFGTYESSTGSVGKYEVSGFQIGGDATQTLGQPVALAIEWHSIEGGAGDPSWNWSSGLSGQISIQDGVELLVLEHLMIASSDFPELCTVGNYVDKLNYSRVSPGKSNVSSRRVPSLARAGSVRDPLDGVWISPDGYSLTLQITPSVNSMFGYVSGTFESGTSSLIVAGFTDINATGDNLSLQSVAISAADATNNSVISLSGTLDLSRTQLSLLTMTSSQTTPENSYVQTSMSSKIFSRA